MIRKPFHFFVLILTLLGVSQDLGGVWSAAALSTLTASGSGLVGSLMSSWAKGFHTANISFVSSTSLLGNLDVINRDVDFAMTNILLTEDQYFAELDLQLLPAVVVPVVVGYNLPGVDGALTLPRAVLADVWSGVVKFWNDSAIKAVNPDLILPDAPIVPLIRQGDAGVTQVFTAALSLFSPRWQTMFGTFSSSDWFNRSTAPLQVMRDDATLAAMLLSTAYTIGYLPLSTAVTKSVPIAKILNARNVSSFPIPSTVQLDLQNLIFDARLTASALDMRSLNSYPILSIVYFLVRMSSMDDCANAYALTEFIKWVYVENEPDKLALDLGYVPLPSAIASLAMRELFTLRCNGKAVRKEVMLKGGGSLQVAGLMDLWTKSYAADRAGIQVDYRKMTATESIRQLTFFELHYAMTDRPVTAQEYAKTADQPLQLIPVVVSAVALIFNLPGARADTTLQWTREICVGVFNGTITTWSHPLIRQRNPFSYLPPQRIKLISISRSSTATLLFQNALATFDPSWSANFSVTSNPVWPKAIQSSMLFSDTPEGIASLVQITPYSVGIVPHTIAEDADAHMIALRNKAGNVIFPSPETIAAAAVGAALNSRLESNILDSAADNAYPIVGFTSFVVRNDLLSDDNCKEAKWMLDFLLWTTENATALSLARSLGYVPAFSAPNPQVHKTLLSFKCDGELIIPPPIVVVSTLNLVPIIIPCVLVILLLGAGASFGYWKLKKRLAYIGAKLNDARLAVELSDAIATFDLDKMAFLDNIERPTTTQRSCQRILHSLRHVKKYVPQALLQQLQHPDDEEELDAEGAAGEDGLGATSPPPGKGPMAGIGSRPTDDNTTEGRSSMSTDEGANSKKRHVAGSRQMKGGRRKSHTKSMTETASTTSSMSKMGKRSVTVLYVCITNFNAQLKVDSAETVRVYNTLIETIFALVNSHNGTISSLDGEHVLIHWNAVRRCTTSRLQACETAAKILAAAHASTPFVLQMALAHGPALYTTIGCDSLCCLSIIGHVLSRARLLQHLNSAYHTSILIDNEVQNQSPSGGAFLVDVVDCRSDEYDVKATKVFELVGEAIQSATDHDGEWLYAFQSEASGGADTKKGPGERQRLWAACADLFFKGQMAKACESMEEYVSRFGLHAAPDLAEHMLAVATTGHPPAVPSHPQPVNSTIVEGLMTVTSLPSPYPTTPPEDPLHHVDLDLGEDTDGSFFGRRQQQQLSQRSAKTRASVGENGGAAKKSLEGSLFVHIVKMEPVLQIQKSE